MKFKEFLEQIKYGECYGLALGFALRQGDAAEKESAKLQAAALTRQGLMELAEKFSIFVGTESVRVPADYAQVRITDPQLLRVIEVSCGGRALKPYSIQDTDGWDYKAVAHGVYMFHNRLENQIVQFLYKTMPYPVVDDDTVLPAPLINALAAYLANRLHNGVGVHEDRMLSVYFARYRDALDDLEMAGYSTLQDMPAKNTKTQGFV